MKRSRKINLLVLSAGLLAIGGHMSGLWFTSNAQRTVLEATNPASERIARQIPSRDLRVKPPQVDEFKARLLARPTRTANAVLLVRFAREEEIPPTITIQLGEKLVTFHDDGRNGDQISSDGIHSAVTTLDLREIELRRRKLARSRTDAFPVFRGRQLVDVKRIDKRLTPLRPGVEFDLLPIGDPDNIDANRSLMIVAPAVVQDPTRTRAACAGSSTGKWSFAYLMQEMANQPVTGITPSEFTLRWLKRWKVSQTVNDFSIPARATTGPNAGVNSLIANWPKNADGSLDLSRAPMRLLAIVNRVDLRGSFSYGGGNGNGGELRFVFGVMDPASATCSPRPFTVIFEYGVRKTTCSAMKSWAQQWKNLDSLVLGSAAYNSALEAITEQIVKRNADPLKTNGSALNQLRTNERSIGTPWELREFQVMPTNGGHLEQVTVKQTPDNFFDNNATLGAYVNEFESQVLLDRHTVPLSYPVGGDAFLGGSSPVPVDNNNFTWTKGTISSFDARHHFSLNTCNSCHAGESKTSAFTHVEVANFGAGTPALSRFLRGATPDTNDNEFFSITDPFNAGTVRDFNDLRRRETDIDALINTPCSHLFALRPILMTH